MFNQPLLFIDSVQNAKKQFVEKYIRNQDIRNDMIIYIDAQSKFLHSALEATSGIISTCGRELFQTKVENYSIHLVSTGTRRVGMPGSHKIVRNKNLTNDIHTQRRTICLLNYSTCLKHLK